MLGESIEDLWILLDISVRVNTVVIAERRIVCVFFFGSSKTWILKIFGNTMVDVLERFQVLLQKEESIYKTSDYLAMIDERKRNVLVPVNTNQISPPCSKRRKCTMDKGQEDQHLRRAGKENCGYPNNHGNHSSLDSIQFYKHYREKMCEWAYRGKCFVSLLSFRSKLDTILTKHFFAAVSLPVIDHLDLSRELVIISMSHLDRYLAVHPEAIKNTSLFRLLTMTCVYLSIKLNEYKYLIALPSESESSTTMDAMLMLGRGLFTRAQMEKMEYDLLQRLQWHVHPPTAPLFLHYLLRFLSVVDHDVRDLAHFQIELSAMNYFFVPYKASEVAAAALLNALEQTHFVMPKFSVTRAFVDLYLSKQCTTFACLCGGVCGCLWVDKQ